MSDYNEDIDYGYLDDLPINDRIDLQFLLTEKLDNKSEVMDDEEWLYF